MKTRSFINQLMDKSKSIVPLVGMGCTILCWTDRKAATIIDVSLDLKTIKVQQDNAIRIDKRGMSDTQEYKYEQNKEASIRIYTLRKNGKYIEKGMLMREGMSLLVGVRKEYYDYSF